MRLSIVTLNIGNMLEQVKSCYTERLMRRRRDLKMRDDTTLFGANALSGEKNTVGAE